MLICRIKFIREITANNINAYSLPKYYHGIQKTK